MLTSQKNNKTKQYIHRVLFFIFNPELLETSINFCNKNPEKEIKNSNELKEKIKEEIVKKNIVVRINNNDFFKKNHNIIKELSFLNLQYEYTKKLSDNLPNNKQNSKSSKNNSINNIENTKNNTKNNTRTNKKNYKTESNILSYKSKILRYLYKYNLPEDVKEDMSESINLMKNIMENDNIKNSINENFKNNNIKNIFQILKENNKYIKYCLIIDEEKDSSHSIIRREMLSREMLSQKGGQSILKKLGEGIEKVSNIATKILLIPFVFIVYCWIYIVFRENRKEIFSILSFKKEKTHYPKMF